MQDAGYPVAPFDFRVPGVTSISADTHKVSQRRRVCLRSVSGAGSVLGQRRVCLRSVSGAGSVLGQSAAPGLS